MKESLYQKNKRLRSERLAAARDKQSHTKKEWEEMKLFFEHTCARCLGESGYANIEKDHIIPLYQGGSDGLENIQPSCALCNSSKGSENIDHRPRLAKFLNKKLPLKYQIKKELYG